MSDDLAEIEVFADELQTVGDPRGELLSLELARERSPASAEARRLNREAQRIRDAHDSLVWPEPLRTSSVGMRAGFVISGQAEQLFAPGVPSELVLSARSISTVDIGLEDCLPHLVRARERGLALDCFSYRHMSRDGRATNLAGMGELGRRRGPRPAIVSLDVTGPYRNLDALVPLEGLRECTFFTRLSDDDLARLEGLALESLALPGSSFGPSAAGLFASTLEQLLLLGSTDALGSLARLSRLRRLALTDVDEHQVTSALAGLPRVQEVLLPALHRRDLVEVLVGLRLRMLSVRTIAGELAEAIGGLLELEQLSIREVVRGPLDLSALSGLRKLRALTIPTEVCGRLELPASFESLTIERVRAPLAIHGRLAALTVIDGDPRVLPRSVASQLRRLELHWQDRPDAGVLASLPRTCPKLEKLRIYCPDADWTWVDMSSVVAGLPHLHELSLRSRSLADLAERGRAFPDLHVLSDHRWPRSCGETIRIASPSSPATTPSLPRDPFDALRGWADTLRAVHDPRGEVLDLELTAELTNDPALARACNRQALALRTSVAALALPSTMTEDCMLLRGGMPIHSLAGWLHTAVVPTWLRKIEFAGSDNFIESPYAFALPEGVGLRPDTIVVHPVSAASERPPLAARPLDGIARLPSVEHLDVLRSVDRAQLDRLPNWRLRHLGLAADNYRLEFITRYGPTLQSLLLTNNDARSTLDGLELPRLERLVLGRGWNPDWALRRRDLRSLEFVVDRADRLGPLDWPALEELALAGPLGDLAQVWPRLRRLRRIHLTPHAPLRPALLELPGLEAMTGLLELSLDCRKAPPKRTQLSLPSGLERLRLRGIAAVEILGRCEQLECDGELIDGLPQPLCDRVRRLTLRDADRVGAGALRRFPVLEWLSLDTQAEHASRARARELGELPRLRTLVIRGLPLGRILYLAASIPHVAVHGLDPGWRDPDRWPRPPD